MMIRYTTHCLFFSVTDRNYNTGMSKPLDLVVLGGGCAGLSLAMALSTQKARCPRTLVVEPRAVYTNDRTWCFWNERNLPAPYPTQHRWQTMNVTQGGRSLSLDCGSTPYHMLAASDFYAAAQRSIEGQPNVTLQLGTSAVGEPSRNGESWAVQTSAGTVMARSVVDTRPSQIPSRDGAALWQSFFGQEIECDAAVFDPSAIDLMNFLAPDSRDVAFVYVLPITATRALVEVTVFGAVPLNPAQLSNKLRAAIADRVGSAAFTILRSEHGILPMGLKGDPAALHPSCVRVGLMAGAARPSTGYAFQRIQHWAGECARALTSGRHPTTHNPDPPLLRTMDRIFLDVLRANPSRGADLFFALFSGADTGRVIRFLSGRGGIVDNLAVVAAMPIPPFLRAALALTLHRSRNGAVDIRA
jgi:lycopene beta-cyclase